MRPSPELLAPVSVVTPWRVPVAARAAVGDRAVVFALAIAGHLALGFATRVVPALAMAHAVVVAVVVLAYVPLGGHVARFVALLAYAASVEVFWRMTVWQLPWELAKYLVIVLGAGLAWRTRGLRRGAAPLLVYVGALVPSLLVLFADPGIRPGVISGHARFYLVAPVALALAAIALAPVRLTRAEGRVVLAATVAGAATLAGRIAGALSGAGPITFDTESNLAVTAGFGPNQVSGALGFGVLAAFLLVMDDRASRRFRLVGAAAGIVLATAAALTFSRGGLYSAGVGIVAASAILARDARQRRRLVVVLGTGALLGAGVVVPRLAAYTSGALTDRFSQLQTTGRDVLVRDDLRLFLEHPVLGTGPGESGGMREGGLHGMGHTEQSRMLAEHGVFGLLSLLALLAAGARALRPSRDLHAGASRVAMAAWALFTMAHLAMRIADIGVAFALGQLAVAADDDAR